MGSPPRMRERRLRIGEVCALKGITPAYAGKTFVECRVFSIAWDHPRVCGKDHNIHQAGCARRGSPPRMRERQLLSSVVRHALGITPAYAGKTL